MRKYTLVFSVVVHAVIVCAAIVVPVVATNAVPRPLERMRVVLTHPDLPAPPSPRQQAPHTPNPDAAPIEEPPALVPEPPMVLAADRFAVDETDGMIRGPLLGMGEGALPGAPREEPPPAPAKPPVPVRVGGVIRPPERLIYVSPEYPPIALAARVEGFVILEALIGEDGRVQDVRVLRSQPLLDAAAETAVKHWRFRPTTLNNQAVPILMTVTVSFKLN